MTCSEKMYEAGNKAAWRRIYQLACIELEISDELKNLPKIPQTTERLDTIALLRSLCEEYGDNDWDDDLHLRDIIDKHLIRYLLGE